MRSSSSLAVFALIGTLTMLPVQPARAGGGLLGIDHRLHYDNSGIWKRSNQTTLVYGAIATVGIGAIALGDQSKLGDTFWRSVDALVVTGVATTAMKYTFQRERPSQTSDPNLFFVTTGSHPFIAGI